MEKKQVLSMLTMLKTAFPSYYKSFTKEEAEQVVDLYEMAFKEDDAQDVVRALKEIIFTSEYPPAIATIKKAIANNKTSNIPQAEDEWNIVLELVSKYGTYRELDALNEMKDYTRYIVKQIGFVNICMADSEQQKWNRKEFIEEYNNLKDKQKELIQISSKGVDIIKMLEEHNEARKLQEIQ